MRLTIRNNKIFFIIIVLILIPNIIVGIKTKQSFKDDVSLNVFEKNLNKFSVEIFDDDRFSQVYFDMKANDFVKIKDSSDLILKVKATSDKKVLNQTLLTKVQVKKIYKGLDYIKDISLVYIYEPCLIEYTGIATMQGYNFMNNNSEYILFLKKLKVPKGYKMSEKEKISFMITNPKWSKFNMDSIKSEDATILNYENNKIPYSSVKKYNQFFLQQKDIDNYKKIKKDIIKNL